MPNVDLNLGNLEQLKRFLLPEASWLITTFDGPITLLGQGVAAEFDHYCNRKFKRNTAHVDQFTADRCLWYLGATPVESITSVQEKYDEDTGWVTLTDAWTNLQTDSGRLYFGAELGTDETILKVTYAGGYWYDATDTQTDTLPANATALPGDIALAWRVQCQHLWAQRDNTGVALARDAGEASKLADYDLIPDVRRILNAYIRYQIT